MNIQAFLRFYMSNSMAFPFNSASLALTKPLAGGFHTFCQGLLPLLVLGFYWLQMLLTISISQQVCPWSSKEQVNFLYFFPSHGTSVSTTVVSPWNFCVLLLYLTHSLPFSSPYKCDILQPVQNLCFGTSNSRLGHLWHEIEILWKYYYLN